MPSAVHDLVVLVVAPVGRDATLIQDALASAEITVVRKHSVEVAIDAAKAQDVGALLVTEESLHAANIQCLAEMLAAQPKWSDLPILVLTVGGAATTLSRNRERDRLPLGSVALLERPIRMATLVSSIRAALRSRSRQYEMRDTLLARDAAEEARKEAESRLITAIDIAKLGTWEANRTTGEIIASATCRKIFDWPSSGKLTYDDLYSRVHPEDRSSMQGKILAAVETRTPYLAEYRVIWRDGSTHWVSVSGRLLDSGKANSTEVRLIGVILDVTARVMSETALRHSDKLALVGRLTSSIAHEINNPLESLTNILYLLGGAALAPTEAEYVAMAQRELARVSEITAQTLSFNRQQNAHAEAVIPTILDSVLTLYQGRFATSNIRVERTYSYHDPVLCYPGELRQVFTNLVGNAFDATRRGGRILVRARLARHPISARRGVRVTVADSGTGMSPEVQSRLFEAFHSTKGNNGTGLGLWISKGIVEKHGGTLRVRSSTAPVYSGSTFTVFLPLQTG